GPVPGRLDDWMRDQLKPTPTDIQETQIGGAEAAIGARPPGPATRPGPNRDGPIRPDRGHCYFNFLAPGPDQGRPPRSPKEAARGFRTLSMAEATALVPYHLQIVPTAGTTPASLAARLPYSDFRMDRLLTLNGVDQGAALMARPEAKIVAP